MTCRLADEDCPGVFLFLMQTIWITLHAYHFLDFTTNGPVDVKCNKTEKQDAYNAFKKRYICLADTHWFWLHLNYASTFSRGAMFSFILSFYIFSPNYSMASPSWTVSVTHVSWSSHSILLIKRTWFLYWFWSWKVGKNH